MTPETIRIVTQLRDEFYTLFAASMKVPVTITNRSSYASTPSMASWVDNDQRLNYVCVYAYTAPDELVPNRPFILRVAVNKGAEMGAIARRGRGYQRVNRRKHFELTVLPSEILDFLPWIVSLAKSYDEGAATLTSDPPHPFDCRMSDESLSHEAWTRQASRKMSQQVTQDDDAMSKVPPSWNILGLRVR
ncbi:MAG: hypothetical protein ACFE0J_12585 [Elainellaceae cyanobacterium]